MPIPTNNSGIRDNRLRGAMADYALSGLMEEETKIMEKAN
jgi:hypothetical protein